MSRVGAMLVVETDGKPFLHLVTGRDTEAIGHHPYTGEIEVFSDFRHVLTDGSWCPCAPSDDGLVIRHRELA